MQKYRNIKIKKSHPRVKIQNKSKRNILGNKFETTHKAIAKTTNRSTIYNYRR